MSQRRQLTGMGFVVTLIKHIFRVLIPATILCAVLNSQVMASMRLDRFYKGNLHTHTLESDGDVSVGDAVNWYNQHGYDFVAITDHNKVLPGEQALALSTDGFIVIPGEEISYSVPSDRPRSVYPRETISVHVNSICATQTAGGATHPSIAQALLAAVQSAREVAPIAIINHPNYEGALVYDDFLTLRPHIESPLLIEIFNGHPHVNNDGSPIWPDYVWRNSTTALWHNLLNSGFVVYAVGTDDSHDFLRDPGFTPRRPGQSWVQVAAENLNSASICRALGQGLFYSSQGPEINIIEYDDSNRQLFISVSATSSDYEIQFIGAAGQILFSERAIDSMYLLGDQPWVRAEVTHLPTGLKAWTQAYGFIHQ